MKLEKDQEKIYDQMHHWIKQKRLNWFFKLGGFAGVGKTVLLSEFIKSYQGHLFVCAPTGKAASVLQRKIGDDVIVTTVHKLIYSPIEPDSSGVVAAKLQHDNFPTDKKLKREYLKAKKQYDNDEVVFAFKKNKELGPEVLILVDEGSMISKRMAKDLEATGCRVVVVGDPGQLPPVKGVDWFGQGEFDAMLNKIRRQAMGSPIIRLSKDIREGRFVASNYQTSDCRIVNKPKVKISELIEADQIICGRNDTRRRMNLLIRKKMRFESDTPLKGEKIICLKNEDLNGQRYINGVVCGTLSDMTTDFGENFIDLDYENSIRKGVPVYDYHWRTHYQNDIEQLMWFDRRDIREFDYAYAITCHKAQGSEFDNLILMDDQLNAQNKNFRKRWLYTGVTRAAKQLTMVV